MGVIEFDPSAPIVNDGAVDHWCFGCGNLNESGLKLRFRAHAAHSVWAELTPSRAHEGYLGMTHGGILATMLDEAMSWAITHAGDIGVTTRMSLTFRQPARVGEPLRVVGEVARTRSRAIDARAVIRQIASGELVAEADARFMRVSREQAAEWRSAYGEQIEGSAFGDAVGRNAGQR
ncbi:MAG TPA: PaaI family thioesterase [Thermomicrobiales bacterium]|nr:PaaI family thioesterase [Thermomicrobiales bacterium]